jgi:hypothetical protein
MKFMILSCTITGHMFKAFETGDGIFELEQVGVVFWIPYSL